MKFRNLNRFILNKVPHLTINNLYNGWQFKHVNIGRFLMDNTYYKDNNAIFTFQIFTERLLIKIVRKKYTSSFTYHRDANGFYLQCKIYEWVIYDTKQNLYVPIKYEYSRNFRTATMYLTDINYNSFAGTWTYINPDVGGCMWTIIKPGTKPSIRKRYSYAGGQLHAYIVNYDDICSWEYLIWNNRVNYCNVTNYITNTKARHDYVYDSNNCLKKIKIIRVGVQI